MASKKTNIIIEEVVKYLEYSNQFSKLYQSIHDFKGNNLEIGDEQLATIPSFCVTADLCLLAEIGSNIAQLVLLEPHMAHKLFNKVIKFAIQALDNGETNLADNIDLTFQVKVPSLPSIIPSPGKSSIPTKGLFVIKGIVVARTASSKYCKSAVYQCPLKSCVGHKGQRMFGSQLSVSSCPTCGRMREEFLRARINGDQVLAVFMPPESFQYNFLRHQGYTVLLKATGLVSDHLTRDLVLGICYNVVASFKPPYIHAWEVERAVSEYQWRFDHKLPLVGIPKAILSLQNQLWVTCPNSPWAVTATLASQLASNLYPVHSFLQLKSGILLSLATQSTEREPVPLLAVGPDCCALLNAASQLSMRRVVLTSPALSVAVGGSTGDIWMEAGPLILASGGVCYLGDWAKFTSSRSGTASQVVTALESGHIDLVASNNTAHLSSQNLPLRATVWTNWSGDKATSNAQAQLRTLIEVFGLPFIGDGSLDTEAVAEHLLLEAMQVKTQSSDNLISMDDLKKYLNIVCSFKVELTVEAKRLLRSYFVASRRERPQILPLTAIKTMTSLAESHARLCLRTQVTYEDVVFVIYLYEETITTLFGPSLMSPPPAVFGGLGIDQDSFSIGQKMTVKLKHFSLWLEQYIKSLLSDNSVNLSIPEE